MNENKEHHFCFESINVCIDSLINLGDLMLIGVGVVGLVSVFLASRQLKLARNAQQCQTAIQLHQEFFKDEKLRDFLYRLDYDKDSSAWRFDEFNFPHSEEEKLLDLLLYKLSFIGTLIKHGDLDIRHLQWLEVEAGIILENDQVLKYLDWIQSPTQIPGHHAFSGAIYLYNVLFGKSRKMHIRVNKYLERTTKKL